MLQVYYTTFDKIRNRKIGKKVVKLKEKEVLTYVDYRRITRIAK